MTVFSKILMANRGEIAIRACRAAHELGARTVAVIPYEDRNSQHRQKADEAYQIGVEGDPVGAYLDCAEILRVAKECGADAIYPGYGFLSENPGLARAAAAEGIAFVGPPAEVLEMTGDKVRALDAARRAGIPTLDRSKPSDDVDYLRGEAARIGFPVFVKAVAGGGGRGLRRVNDPEDLPDALASAMREADMAFGDHTMFVERAVVRPRHIEVQILADSEGDVVHLFERDCSVQRRHQKLVEVAPAPNLDDGIRAALHADAVRFAREVGYVNAGTVEFLVDTAGERAGEHVFIEMNPGIQVEHTVTEEITDVDLVSSQLRIAAGATLPDLDISQDRLSVRGAALQCRITTEDPSDDFRPDVGRISAYRPAGGAGVRLDSGTAYVGAEISPHFDSLLVKLICRGGDLDTAVRRARRALAEFRIRGVATNIAFLDAVLADARLVQGDLATDFIENRPELVSSRTRGDRATKALTWLAEVTVNAPNGPRVDSADPRAKLPRFPRNGSEAGSRTPAPGPGAPDPAPGWRQTLRSSGPEGFARALREQTSVAVTSTTFRDAHQSLLATRVHSRDLVAAAPAYAHTLPQLLSLEAWGGATYDVALRFLGEDPWDRLAELREAVPNIPLQMLLRGRNTVGYTPVPTEVTRAFVAEAADTGVDPQTFQADPQKFDVPDSVIGFLAGVLGVPPGGCPEPFRTRVLAGRRRDVSPTALTDQERDALVGPSSPRRDTLNRILFPGPAQERDELVRTYGDLSVLDTRDFLYGLTTDREHVIHLEKGVELVVRLHAVTDPDEKGIRTVILTLNGQMRMIDVRDKSVSSSTPEADRADPSRPGDVAAPFAGAVTVTVGEGETIEAGAQVATIEAMKMQATITSPVGGMVRRVAIDGVTQVDGGDLLVVVDAPG